ncbi:uncharacterized protein JCM15063_001180 [Sporobolomyces koalae]|uniref:uncharacterized protein n=1 Tax=Sporobolomyces koalae TaxID=500713 RepID=UPI0031701A93
MSAWAQPVASTSQAWPYPPLSSHYPQSQPSNPGSTSTPVFEPWEPTSSGPYGTTSGLVAYDQPEHALNAASSNYRATMHGHPEPPPASHVHRPPASSHASHNQPTYSPAHQYHGLPANRTVIPATSSYYSGERTDFAAPVHADSTMSATAQRFQNTVPPARQSRQPLPQPQPVRNSLPVPTAASVQQYHAKVDELALLENRLAQLANLYNGGTLPVTGPGANQLISAPQRSHLELQMREIKNRQATLLHDCEAFKGHFGPASVWDAPSAGAQAPTNERNASRMGPTGLSHQQCSTGASATPAFAQQNSGSAERSPYGNGVSQTQLPSQQQFSRSLAPSGVPAYAHGSWVSSSSSGRPPESAGHTVHSPYLAHQRFSSAPSSTTSPANAQVALPAHQQAQPSPQHYPHQQPLPRQSSLTPTSASFPHLAPPSAPPPPPHHVHPQQFQQFDPRQATPQLHAQYPAQQRGPQGPSPSTTPVAAARQQLPPGLQAQMDAIDRDKTASGGGFQRGDSSRSGNAALARPSPLQVLIKKAENGEMPVMTMAGLRKQSEVDREKQLEEEREQAREKAREQAQRTAANSEPPPTSNAIKKGPTGHLQDVCRQGGGASLAEMVLTLDHQVFWSQLRQICAKQNIDVVDEIQRGAFVIENRPVDLLQLFQTVVSRGGGYAKIDAGDAWSHVATLLSIPSRSAGTQSRIKEIYHRVLAPFEDLWATQMIKLREKHRTTDGARSVIGAMPGANSSPNNLPPNASPAFSTQLQMHPMHSPATSNPQLVVVPSPPTGPSSIAASSSMSAGPVPINGTAPTFAGYPSSAINAGQSIPRRAPSQPSEKTSSADLLEQARALRQRAVTNVPSNAALSASQQQSVTTSPPQETSSTPQEAQPTSLLASANLTATPNALKGERPPTKAPGVSPSDLVVPAVAVPRSNAIAPVSRKRKKDETEDTADVDRTRSRTRSMSNLEAPVVGEQTNEPHFNPFEIAHFLPFTTAAPTVVPSPSHAHPQPLYPPLSESLIPVNQAPRPEPTQAPTRSPLANSAQLATATPTSITQPTMFGSSTITPSQLPDRSQSTSASANPPFSASYDPASIGSLSLSLSLDPNAASRPGSSWSPTLQQYPSAIAPPAFEPFGSVSGLDAYDFAPTHFADDPLVDLNPQSSHKHLNDTMISNWSPQGLDGFDFANTFA